MSELKNLKIDATIHAALAARAKRLGMKIGKLADAILRMGLRQSDNLLQSAALDNDDETTLQADTKKGRPKP